MRWSRGLRVLGVLVLLLLAYFVAPVQHDPVGGLVLRASCTVLLLAGLAIIVVVQIRHVVRDPRRSVDGLVTAIALVWVAFAFAFYLVDLHRPEELEGLHTRLDALYFTASTMLTIGYGDVHAVGQLARGMALVQMAFDIAFVATAGAVLSARVRTRAEQRAGERTEPPG